MPLRTSSQHAPGYYGTVATFLPILFNCQRAILPVPRPEGGWLQSANVITLAYCGVCVKWLLVWTSARDADLKSLCGDPDAGTSMAEAVATLHGLSRG